MPNEFNAQAAKALRNGYQAYRILGDKSPLYNNVFKLGSNPTMRGIMDNLIHWYTQGGANEISDALNLKMPPDKAATVLQKASTLNSIINNVEPTNRYKGPLYRGVIASKLFGEKDIHKLQVGDAMVSDVPVSFTQNYDRARDTFANKLFPGRNVIAVPQSSQGVTIGPLSSYKDAFEREVLIPKGTGYKVTNIRNIPESPNPVRLIEAQEVPNFNTQAARSLGQRVWTRGLKASGGTMAAASMLPELLGYYLSSPSERARMEQDARTSLLGGESA